MTRESVTRTQQQMPTTHPLSSGILQRKCACGQQTIAGGDCEECQKKESFLQLHPIDQTYFSQPLDSALQPFQESRFQSDFSRVPIQTKLKMGQPNDKYEQEADWVAHMMMQTQDSEVVEAKPISDRITFMVQGSMDKQQEEEPIQGSGVYQSVGFESQIKSMRGRGKPLTASTRAFFEPRFGWDFSQVRIHTGAQTDMIARSINAKAFTLGNNIAFSTSHYASETDAGKKLLAHELTHVVQQVGNATAVQRYTMYSQDKQNSNASLGWKHPDNKPLMVSDDGKMATEYKPWHSKKAWVLSSLISQTNQTLTNQGSQIRVKAGAQQIKGKAPNQSSTSIISLNDVKVESPLGGAGRLTGDCGTACFEAMGGTGAKRFKGVTNPSIGVYRTPEVAYRGGYGRGSNTVTNELSGYIFVKVMSDEYGRNLTLQQAREAYDKLPPKEKERIDKKYGINKYVNPKVGQGLTIGTEFNMPGFLSDKELAQHSGGIWGGIIGGILGAIGGGLLGLLAGPAGLIVGGLLGGLIGGLGVAAIGRAISGSRAHSTWNFHFATVLFKSGEDYITIENVAQRTDTDWLFMMYGSSKKKQSFHDFQSRVEHGNKSTSMVVEEP